MRHAWENVLRWGPPERYDSHEVIMFEGMRYVQGFPPENANDFMEWLAALISQVPAEFRNRASLEIDSEGDYDGSHYAKVKFSYRRPETDEELGIKQARYAEALAQKDAHERAVFEALSRKYAENKSPSAK